MRSFRDDLDWYIEAYSGAKVKPYITSDEGVIMELYNDGNYYPYKKQSIPADTLNSMHRACAKVLGIEIL